MTAGRSPQRLRRPHSHCPAWRTTQKDTTITKVYNSLRLHGRPGSGPVPGAWASRGWRLSPRHLRLSPSRQRPHQTAWRSPSATGPTSTTACRRWPTRTATRTRSGSTWSACWGSTRTTSSTCGMRPKRRWRPRSATNATTTRLQGPAVVVPRPIGRLGRGGLPLRARGAGTARQEGLPASRRRHPDTVQLNGYPIDLLYGNMGKMAEAASIRVFLDACFSGDRQAGMLIRSASPVFVSAALPNLSGKSMAVLTATSGDEVASWDEQAEHGMFTHHLLARLASTRAVQERLVAPVSECNLTVNIGPAQGTQRGFASGKMFAVGRRRGRGGSLLPARGSGTATRRDAYCPLMPTRNRYGTNGYHRYPVREPWVNDRASIDARVSGRVIHP